MANDGSSDQDTLEIDLSVPSDRRKFLGMLSAAGVTGLAGCSGNGGGDDPTATETDTPTDGTDTTGGDTDTTTEGGPGMTEQELSTFVSSTTADSPEPKALTEWGWAPSNYRSQYPRGMYPFLFGRKVAIIEATGERIPMLIQDWTAEPGMFEYTIHEDATWSDGTDITGEDLMGMGMTGHKLSHEAPAEELDSIQSWDQGITGMEADGKTFRILSDIDAFEDFWMDPIMFDQINHAGSAEFTTQAGWSDWLSDQLNDQFDDLWDNSDANQVATALGSETIQENDYWPNSVTEIPFSSAFQVDQVLEGEVHLEKNDEWLYADQVNWPQVTLIAQNNAQAQNALIQNNEVEMVTMHGATESIIESYPDNMQQFPYGAGDSTNVLAQGQHPHFGKPPVRKAILQALDREQLRNVANPYNTAAISEPPGLHAQREERFLSQEFQDQFTQYPYDTDAAAEWMESAGYSLESGTWRTPEGERLTAELITSSDNLQMESTIVSQLNAFGINTSLSKITDTQFGSRLDNGNFELAIEGWGTRGAVWGPAILGIYYRAFQQSVRRKKWGMFPEDETMAFIDRHEEVENVEYSWTNNVEGIWPNPDLTNPEVQDEWVPALEAPPIGEPDSDETVTYPVVYWGIIWNQNLTDEERTEIIRGVTWVYNQTLMPYIPYLESNQLAFQDVEDWNVPEEGNKYWDQWNPQHKLIEQPQNTYEAAGDN